MRTLRQLACKKEATPGTVEASIAAADITFKVTDDSRVNVRGEPIETGEVQANSSSRPVAIGSKIFEAEARAILRAHVTPLTAAPYTNPLFEMAMFVRRQIKQITIGAVTGGPFKNNEIIRVAGVDRGVVFRDTSATPLKYYVIAGAIANLDVITGATSGATATASGAPIDQGQLYMLSDSDFEVGIDTLHHYTIESVNGKFFKKGRGCLGQMSMEFRVGDYCKLRSQILGAWESQGDRTPYTVTYAEDGAGVVTPKFTQATLFLEAYQPTDIVDFGLSIPLGLELRLDANHAAEGGVRLADYQRQNDPPIVTFDPAMVGATTYDFYTKYKAETTFAMRWQLGTKFFFYADECQFVDVGEESRRSLQTVPLQVRLCGKTNNELQIYCTS